MKWNCKKCGEEQFTFDTKNAPPITCLKCSFKSKRDFDMNKLEEYLQGDHGHVISPNY